VTGAITLAFIGKAERALAAARLLLPAIPKAVAAAFRMFASAPMIWPEHPRPRKPIDLSLRPRGSLRRCGNGFSRIDAGSYA